MPLRSPYVCGRHFTVWTNSLAPPPIFFYVETLTYHIHNRENRKTIAKRGKETRNLTMIDMLIFILLCSFSSTIMYTWINKEV